MINELKQLIMQGEGVQLDFKQVIQDPRKIAKSMVSFANTVGGILLIGVRDNGSISGINFEEEIHMLDLAASFYCKPELKYEVKPIQIEGKIILKVKISKGDHQPYYAKGADEKWWVYVRVNDNCILASKTTVDFMHKRNKPAKLTVGKLEQEIIKFISEREKTSILDICGRFNLGKRRVSRILVILMSFQIIRSHTFEKTEFYTAF